MIDTFTISFNYFISSDITNDYDARILVECYKSALRTVVNQRNLSQAEAEKEMRIWLSELQTGELTRIEFWDRVMECKGYCAPVMATLSVCLLYTYKDYLVAPIIFDFADSEYKENTEGDSRSRFETHCNSTVIKKAVIKANENPDNRILLVGRASRIGEKFRELKRSEDRVKSVISELYNWGIPNNKIYYRYLGYDEPQIYDKTAEVLNITDIFEGIGEHTINQSVMVYVYNPKKLEIPGAVQAMSRPIGY